MQASLIVDNADIHTLDPARPRARALAALGETILAVGDDSDVASLRGPGTEVVDLGGRTAIPGLIDAHVHLLMFGLGHAEVDLSAADSVEAAVARVRAGALSARRGDWVLGHGWDPNRWTRWPTGADLEAVLPGVPVALWSHDRHSLWVSRAALTRAGVDSRTSVPDGGAIDRNENGAPTGVLRERAAGLVADFIPAPTADEVDVALRRAIARANELGLVGVHTVEGATTLAGVQRLRADDQLSLRICANLARDDLDAAITLGIRSGLGDDWLRIGGLKLFADGALGSQTAWMLRPYERSMSRGVQVLDPTALRDVADRAARNGIALTIHAIGDAAVCDVLDALAHARSVGPAHLRHRIEHAQLVDPDDLARFGALDVVASMQPVHATSDIDIADRHWGTRARTAYAWRSLLDAGATLAFGSDCPVETLDPIAGIHAAVTRQRVDGTPEGGWYPEQCLTVEQAVRAYTLGAAYAAGEESRTGTLTSGKRADVTVLSSDLFGCPPAELRELRVDATIVGGRVVFRRA